ncbi:MAG: YcxB family protein [Sandaracinaceae bacterium]|nr:YcxB family protein [Sandaracinaceae bacterium]
MEPVEADVEVTEDDYVEAFEASGQKGGRVLRRALVVLAVAAAALVALSWPFPPGAWVLVVPVALLAAWLAPRQSGWLARRAFAARPAAWNAVRVALTEDEVRLSAELLETRRAWSRVDGWLETPRLFALVGASTITDVWPKAAFGDDEARERVRALLARCVPAHGTGRDAAGRPEARDARTRRLARKGRVVLLAILALTLVALYAVWRSA